MYDTPTTTTTTDYSTTTSAHLSPAVGIAYVAIAVLMIAALWKVFVKAGRPGWAAIIPIYSTYVLVKIARRPGWWLLLLLVPLVNLVILIIVSLDIAKAFGRSAVFAIFGLIIFPYIGYPMLGFGKDQYHGGATPALPADPAGAPPAAPAI